MNIVGYILIAIGAIAFLAGLYISLKEQLKKEDVRSMPQEDRALELKDLKELLDKFLEVLKEFKALSIGVQWAFLGLACMGVGAYLLQLG